MKPAVYKLLQANEEVGKMGNTRGRVEQRMAIDYRHPCVATEPIMFSYGLFLFFFYSPFVLRNYSTYSHQIFMDCVFWCSLNNPVVLKFF